MMKSIFVLSQYLILIVLICEFVGIAAGENVKKSVDDSRDDNGESDDSKDESMDIPVENETNNLTCTRRQNSLMHEIRSAKAKEFPFMAAVMSHQNEYLCSGSVVSNGLILTTAQCTQQPISYVLLDTINDKKDEAVTLHITKSEKFPTYTGGESLKDVGLIYTEKHNSSVASKIRLSNFTSSRNLVDLVGVGFGLNADVGQTKELQYIGMEHRSPYDPSDIMRAYFDCIETKVMTCYKDTGGPIIFNNELVGIVIKGQDDCTKEMSSSYAISKRMADILPTYTFKAWLDERIKKNEDQEPTALATYPSQPAQRHKVKMTVYSRVDGITPHFSILMITTIFMFVCFA